MHSVSAPIPIPSRGDCDRSFGDSAEMYGFTGIPDMESLCKQTESLLPVRCFVDSCFVDQLCVVRMFSVNFRVLKSTFFKIENVRFRFVRNLQLP